MLFRSHLKLIVSDSLVAQLDDEELEAVLSHEMGHLVYAGNHGMVLLWILRAFQACNPAALVLFRMLIEARENACDALAAFVMGRAEPLASALLKLHDTPPLENAGTLGSSFDRARIEVLRHAEVESSRQRVRALLDHPAQAQPGLLLSVLFAVAIGGVLWAVG